MGKIKAFFRNKWVGFALASLLYTLWFVVWTGNLWMLLGLAVIFDLYITKFFYRYVWCHNARMCQQSKVYKTVYEWVNAIIFATVVASLVHIFVFQMYVIPTSSMEKSLLIGDYLYVSKVTYGPQMPNTPLSFPFVHHTMPFSQTKKSFSEAVKWPYHRLKGLRKIKRNDVVVFNFPAGDTVLLTTCCAATRIRSAKRRDASVWPKNTPSSAAPWTNGRITSNAAWPFRATRSKYATGRCG